MRQSNDHIATLRDNLRELDSRKALVDEQRQISLSLLVSHLTDSDRSKDAAEIYADICRLLTKPCGEDKIFVCRELIKQEELLGEELFSDMLTFSENTAAGSHEKVAYVRNRYNDTAFSLLTEQISNAKPVYVSSFSNACEEVLDSKCEFCILPIEDSNDCKLFGFYSMLDRYDLKIVSVCDIENEERGNTVRYALAGKGLSRKSFAAISRKKLPCSFEFSIISPDATFSCELISAAKKCEAITTKTDSLPVEYDDKLRRFFFTMDIHPHGLYPLSLYLALEYSSYNFIGFYPKNK